MKRFLAIPALLVLALATVACDQGTGGPDGQTQVTSSVTLRLDRQPGPDRARPLAGVRSIPYDIERLVLTVTGPGMEPIRQEIEIQPEQEVVELTVQVPNGPARTFRVDAYEVWNPFCIVFTGSATVELSGSPVDLVIVMERVDSMPVFDGLQSAVATGLTSVELSWDPASDPTTPPEAIQYLVFVAENSGGQDFTTPAILITGDTRADVSNLQPGTTYYFVVRARNESGCADVNAAERAATTQQEQDTQPPVFEGLESAVAIGTSSVELAWPEASDNLTPPAAIQYLVFVSLSPAGQNFLDPVLTVTGTTGALVEGLLADTTYYFVVRARDEAGNTEANTVERSATTEPGEQEDTEPPSFAGLSSASPTGTSSVVLSWSAASDNVTPAGAIRYLVFVSQVSGSYDFTNPVRTVTGEILATISGLQPATTYFFVVRARDEAGNTETNTVERSAATAPLEPEDAEPPSFAGLQTASASGTDTVLLAWSAASDNVTPASQIRYLVFVSQTPGGYNFASPTRTLIGAVSASITGLDPATTYHFVVRARDAAGNTETNTVERSATTDPDEEQDTEPPVFAGLQTAEPEPESYSSVLLTWSPASDNVTSPEQIDYLVFVADTPGGQNFANPHHVVTGDLSTVVGGLEPDRTYYFVVRARDQAGNTELNTEERSAATPFYEHWLIATELPVARLNSVAAAPGNGYVYIINGYTDSSSCSVGTADGRAFFAAHDQMYGTLGPWQETLTGADNFRRSAAGVAQWNGTIYLGGGAINSPSWDGNVYYAQPETDGSITQWLLAPPLPGSPNWVGSWPFMAAHNGYLYIGGGRRAFGVYSDRLYYTPLLDAGSPSENWVQITLPSPAAQGQLLFYEDWAYLILGIEGCDGCNTSRVFMAEVLPGAGGALGQWTETTPLPVAANHPSAHFLLDMGILIAIPGGGRSVYLNSVDPQDGTLGEWMEWDPLPEDARPFDQGILAGEDYYLIGDQDCGASAERLRRVRHERFQF